MESVIFPAVCIYAQLFFLLLTRTLMQLVYLFINSFIYLFSYLMVVELLTLQRKVRKGMLQVLV